MRRFKFRLETVLNHRETIEKLREQDFARAQQMLAAIEARMAVLREEFRLTVAGRPGTIEGERFDAPGILDRERYLQTLIAAIAQQERRASAAQVVVAQMRKALVAARQAREAVSRLRERNLTEYNALAHKIAQEAMDELATLRHARALREKPSPPDPFFHAVGEGESLTPNPSPTLWEKGDVEWLVQEEAV